VVSKFGILYRKLHVYLETGFLVFCAWRRCATLGSLAARDSRRQPNFAENDSLDFLEKWKILMIFLEKFKKIGKKPLKMEKCLCFLRCPPCKLPYDLQPKIFLKYGKNR